MRSAVLERHPEYIRLERKDRQLRGGFWEKYSWKKQEYVRRRGLGVTEIDRSFHAFSKLEDFAEINQQQLQSEFVYGITETVSQQGHKRVRV